MANPSITRAGLQGAQPGTPVLMIDRNGEAALGFLEAYDETNDSFDVVLFDRKAEVTARTDQSASARFGDFGGDQIQTVPVLRLKGCVYFNDARIGQPRLVLASQDAQVLRDAIQQNMDQFGFKPDAGTADSGASAGGNVSDGAKDGPPAPPEQGKATAPAHPDIPVGVVQEAETPAIPPEEQKGRLPDGFPGLAALTAVGIVKFKDLKKVKDLTAIVGIGQVTADKIKAALGG